MKRIWIVLIVLGLVLVALGGIGFTLSQSIKKAQDQLAGKQEKNVTKLERGDIVLDVVETGSLEAVKVVDVKSNVGGRVAKLFVEEGDFVEEGQLIAIIDPQETELRVAQNRAQLKGAQSSVRRLDVEMAQRRQTIQTQIKRSELQVQQLEMEMKAQPQLTSASIKSAQTNLATAQKNYDLLTKVAQPNATIARKNAVTDAKNNLINAQVEAERQKELYDLGYATRRAWEQAQLQQQLAETRLAESNESLSRLESEQRIERDRAMEQVNQAQAQLDQAKTNRFQDDVKRQQYERALADLRDARTSLRDIDVLRENKVNSQASVEQIESVLGDSLRQLGETEIRAPFTGIISRKFVELGELVAGLSSFNSGTSIVQMEDRDSMLVKLEINEIDVARLAEGMDAEITVDAFANKTFRGKVQKIAPSLVASATGGVPTGESVVKYQVEVRLNESDKLLKTGMSAKCTMQAVNKNGVLRLPLDYVGLDEKGRFVEVVLPEKDKDGKPKAERKEVVTGVNNSTHIEILSGVDEGVEVRKPEYKGPSRKGMMQFGPDDEE